MLKFFKKITAGLMRDDKTTKSASKSIKQPAPRQKKPVDDVTPKEKKSTERPVSRPKKAADELVAREKRSKKTSRRSERQYDEKPKADSRRKSNSNRPKKTKQQSQSYQVIPEPEKALNRYSVPPKPEKLEVVPPEEGKKRFADLPIHEDILYGLQELDFKYCTPIQEKTLPTLLEGRDLTGKAQTGTGKTAAFLIAAFTHILNNPETDRLPGTCRVLVLAPTRELAMQIHKDAEALSCYTKLDNLVIFGGMDYQKQRRRLENPIDILVGTPGRIIDYSRNGYLKLAKTEILVIDEADRMLDMGFIPDVRRIVNQLPPAGRRQTMFFSATLDPKIIRLVESWLIKPVTVESESEQLVTDLIDQQFYAVTRREKIPMLLWLLGHEQYERVIIFGNRKDRNEELVRQLARYNIYCVLLSGDVPQEKRMKILERFRQGTERILIATDVAARGIHVDDVSLVINYDLPEHPEDYIHRIGRTGRAGKTGRSVGLVCEFGGYVLPDLEKLLGRELKCNIPDDEMVKMPSQFEWRDLMAMREREEHERSILENSQKTKAEAAAIIEAGNELPTS